MKLQQLEYIIAIAQAGSITAAAKSLYQAQPNISIALKELETEIGKQIFWRTPNGMVLTPEGEGFLVRAKDIVESMHSLEADYTNSVEDGINLRISSVRSSYIPELLSDWINELDNDEKLCLRFIETTSNKVIEDVNSGRADMGIIRIPAAQFDVYEEQMYNRKFIIRPLTSYVMQPLVVHTHPLANREDVTIEELEMYPEVLHADDEMSLLEKNHIDSEREFNNKKRIYAQDNGSKVILLQRLKNAYMWSTPTSDAIAYCNTPMKHIKCSQVELKTVDMLICKRSNENNRVIKLCMDALIEKVKGYKGTEPFEIKSEISENLI